MNDKIRLSDPDLVKAVSEKSMLEAAIHQIYQEHSEINKSFIMGRGGTDQDADDIFQETVVAFIDIVQKGKFRQESGIRTFLISISKNLWYNEIRRRKRAGNREKVFESSKDQLDEGIDDMNLDRELKLLMNQLLKDIGASCRKILELFYYENLPMKEIVSHLQYGNEQVARNKKYKCLRQLTEKMKQNPLVAKQISELIFK